MVLWIQQEYNDDTHPSMLFIGYKVYQLLARGRWFSPDTPTFSTTKTGRHDIAEILLKVALNTKNQSIHYIIEILLKVALNTINLCM
jgi:hypothetical protein